MGYSRYLGKESLCKAVAIKTLEGVIYRRLGFNCEYIINANRDFSSRVQLLERNIHVNMTQFCGRDPRVNAILQL